MGWIIGLLTFVLVLNCVFLILLILVQLPKKEAGIGQAFGGSATDALFGAGSGTALTKLTKYATGFFLALTLVLTVLNSNRADSQSAFEEQLKSLAPEPPPAAAQPAPVAAPLPPLTTLTNAVTNAAPVPEPVAPTSTPPAETAPPPGDQPQ